MPDSKIPRRSPTAEVTVVKQHSAGGAEQCALCCEGRRQVHVLLLPDGLFALYSLDRSPVLSPSIYPALGHLVCDHANRLGQAVTVSQLASEVADLEGLAAGERVLRWADSPTLTVTFRPGPQEALQCVLRAGLETALLFVRRDPVLPIAWIQCSTPAPTPLLLTAVGRILISHFQAVQRLDPGTAENDHL